MASTHSFTVFKGDAAGNITKDITERTLHSDEVLIRVTHSGLCGTDCHFRKSGIALGHEGVGIVEVVGDNCHKLKKGDLVGWGYIHDTCRDCQKCLSGNEVFCEQTKMYGIHNQDQGSLATHAIWKEVYVFPIPAGMDPSDAAPLMCAGATIFAALYDHGVTATDTVGVVGIGGLGHLAIQFAAKMGCRVVVFSSTEDKREEAMKLGASEFYATKGLDKVEVEHTIDFLLVTTSYLPTWDLYLNAMTRQGTIFPLTYTDGMMNIPYMLFLSKGLKIVGCVVSSRWVQKFMLDFASRTGVKAMVEEFPMTENGITQAFDKMESGKLRYRAVLKN